MRPFRAIPPFGSLSMYRSVHSSHWLLEWFMQASPPYCGESSRRLLVGPIATASAKVVKLGYCYFPLLCLFGLSSEVCSCLHMCFPSRPFLSQSRDDQWEGSNDWVRSPLRPRNHRRRAFLLRMEAMNQFQRPKLGSYNALLNHE